LAITLKHIIYASTPFGFSRSDLDHILIKSRYNNDKNDITGALFCRDDLYLQYLEGPEKEIDLTFSKITEDDRHTEIQLLKSGISTRRLFANWAMKDDPVQSWMWTKEEIDNGVLEKVTEIEAMEIFVKHSRETDQFL
jgi:hypothetical protein|tara:strand:+ start:94 stop:507 length:414 start_codon:yes stop_codon:yes gene_type:complete